MALPPVFQWFAVNSMGQRSDKKPDSVSLEERGVEDLGFAKDSLESLWENETR
jgi:hypothetical protein